MDENKIISLENLNQYSDETSDKIKSYVDTKLNGGAELSGSTGYTVTDSVDYPLVGLKVFGKSTQDGTPTPENPVEIVRVENPTVTVCGKNLLNLTLQTTTQNGVTITNNGDGTYTLNGTTTDNCYLRLRYISLPVGNYRITGCPQGGSYATFCIATKVQNQWVYEFGNGFNISVSGAEVFVNDRIEIHIKKNVVIDNLTFKPMITTDQTATYDDFEPYKGNTITLPYTLNAIPVSSGGNVTIDGQEYIADYVDFVEGRYHKLVDPNKLDPTISIFDNLDLLLASEEITDISESEMQAYRQLQTYNGTTNISNDKGAGLSVEYCTNNALSTCVAPITTGLQKQIDELKAAVLSLGGNV